MKKIYSFIFKDSAILYIAKGQNTFFNMDNISNLEKAMEKKVAQEEHKVLIIENKDSVGFWKDITLGDISIGYTRVLPKEKKKFDKMVTNLSQPIRKKIENN